MTRITLLGFIFICLSGLSSTGMADQENDAAATTATISTIKSSIARLMPGRQPDSIETTVIPGLFEVMMGADIFYVTSDGKHLLQGDLYALESKTNLTEEKRSEGRLALIKTIDPATEIIFKPENTRHVVNIFTDIDCGYCRKLHSEIDTYLARGIEIRYIAFPRSGYRTRSYFKAVSAWCADDPKKALTLAKSGQELEQKTCDNPVDQHLALAHELGLTGTPTMVFADGSIVPGYIPAEQLEEILNQQSL